MSYRSLFFGVLSLWLLVSVARAQSVAPEAAPQLNASLNAYDLVEKTTAEVMKVVIEAESYVDDDPERYYQQVQAILDPLIDYRGFARKVMGPYASSKRYRSLDNAGKAQLRDQLDSFTEAMRLSLIRTYSKGLLAFGSARINVQRPEEEPEDASRASVRQLIYAENPDPYRVLYQMGIDDEAHWKLLNVIIEDVNLGEIYRDQFLASAREQDGDLDAVIANWSSVTVEIDR